MPVQHTGVYRFVNNQYTGYSLNAYTSSAASNGTNVCLYPTSSTDVAQRWKANYAGTKSDGKKLYFFNLAANGTGYGNNMALDRNTSSTNTHNAQTYRSVSPTLAGNDQLVYMENESTDTVVIRLLDGRALTAVNPNGGTSGTSSGSSTAASNVYWATYSSTNNAQKWQVKTVTTGTTPSTTGTNPSAVTTFPQSAYFTASANSNFPQYLGECVWYVKGRYKEVKGSNCPYTGNANALYGLATDDNKSKTVAKAGSIACWNGGSYGHVAFVESVGTGTNPQITYTQANWYSDTRLSNGQIYVSPAGTDGKSETKTKSAFEGMYSGFQGYIYK